MPKSSRRGSTNTDPPEVSVWFKINLPEVFEIDLLQNE
jgi:hypothetical protein